MQEIANPTDGNLVSTPRFFTITNTQRPLYFCWGRDDKDLHLKVEPRQPSPYYLRESSLKIECGLRNDRLKSGRRGSKEPIDNTNLAPKMNHVDKNESNNQEAACREIIMSQAPVPREDG